MIDRVEVWVKAGDGGVGMVSFRREKFVPFGGPYGGDGGRGGDVVLVGDASASTLRAFSYRHRFRAENGKRGETKTRHGRDGKDLELRVPPGTVVKEKGEEEGIVADLTQQGQRVIMARGGMGGRGNARFATSTQQAPRFAEKGEAGEEKWLILELKLIADVGIVGYPNVGKSTLLGAVSAARPKIADYPFTTLEPMLGVVEVGDRSFVIADMPGVIEGAHLGRGLGHQFLRHIERTRLLIHLLDGTSASPIADYEKLNRELGLFNPSLLDKPDIVAVNKLDIPEVRERRSDLERELEALGRPLFFISAAAREGVVELMKKAAELLTVPVPELPRPSGEGLRVFRPQPRERVSVLRADGLFVVRGVAAVRAVSMTDLTSPQGRAYLWRRLTRMGVPAALRRAGAQPGDRVRFGQIELEWE